MQKQVQPKSSVKPVKKKIAVSSVQVSAGRFFLENPFLKVVVQNKGWITIEDKAQKEVYSNLHVFEVADNTMRQDQSHVPSKKSALRCLQSLRISLIEEGPLVGTIRIRVRMKVSAKKIKGLHQMYPRKHNVKIWTTIRLKASEKHVAFETRVESEPISKSVNILFPTGCQKTETAHGSVSSLRVFDWKKRDSRLVTAVRYVQLIDKKRGFAIHSENPFTYDLRLDNQRTLAFHLIPSGEKFVPPKTFMYGISFVSKIVKLKRT